VWLVTASGNHLASAWHLIVTGMLSLPALRSLKERKGQQMESSADTDIPLNVSI
jgi:hypothetical protein